MTGHAPVISALNTKDGQGLIEGPHDGNRSSRREGGGRAQGKAIPAKSDEHREKRRDRVERRSGLRGRAHRDRWLSLQRSAPPRVRSADMELIEIYARCVGHQVRPRRDSGGGNSYQMQYGDVALWD